MKAKAIKELKAAVDAAELEILRAEEACADDPSCENAVERLLDAEEAFEEAKRDLGFAEAYDAFAKKWNAAYVAYQNGLPTVVLDLDEPVPDDGIPF